MEVLGLPQPAVLGLPQRTRLSRRARSPASVRAELGDDTPLTLTGATTTRSYATLSALEADTLMARIWAGLHFRDSMEDTYYVGHTNAARVRAALD